MGAPREIAEDDGLLAEANARVASVALQFKTVLDVVYGMRMLLYGMPTSLSDVLRAQLAVVDLHFTESVRQPFSALKIHFHRIHGSLPPSSGLSGPPPPL